MYFQCQSTIAPLYQQETVHKVLKPDTRPITPEPLYPTEFLESEDFKEPHHESDHTFLWVLPTDTTAASTSSGNSTYLYLLIIW